MAALTAGLKRLHDAYSSWHSVDAGILVLRLGAGAAFMMHGINKLFAVYANVAPAGPHQAAAFFGSLGIPAPHFFAYLVGLVELIGGFLLGIGLLTPIAAISLAVDMLIAIATYNWANGFFTETPRDGWEINMIYFVLLIAVLIVGPGRWSVDRVLGLAPSRRAQVRQAGLSPPLDPAASPPETRAPAG